MNSTAGAFPCLSASTHAKLSCHHATPPRHHATTPPRHRATAPPRHLTSPYARHHTSAHPQRNETKAGAIAMPDHMHRAHTCRPTKLARRPPASTAGCEMRGALVAGGCIAMITDAPPARPSPTQQPVPVPVPLKARRLRAPQGARRHRTLFVSLNQPNNYTLPQLSTARFPPPVSAKARKLEGLQV